ncbi:MAG: hypothetical protein AAF560_13975 [Acidobacteriota bacterium]
MKHVPIKYVGIVLCLLAVGFIASQAEAGTRLLSEKPSDAVQATPRPAEADLLLASIDSLSANYARLADQLQQLADGSSKPAELQPALAAILLESSQDLLVTAKQFGQLGAQISLPLGELAAAFEGASLTLMEDLPWLVVEHLDAAAASFVELSRAMADERDEYPEIDESGPVLAALHEAELLHGRAANLVRATARGLAADEAPRAWEELASSGPTFDALANTLTTYRRHLDALTFWPWSDSCTCGTTRWVAGGITGWFWVFEQCVLVHGRLCSTCEWQPKRVKIHKYPGPEREDDPIVRP